MTLRMSKGKFEGLNTCANEHGCIAALAVDHRQNLLQAIATARGAEATAHDMQAFKAVVAKVLSPYASAILLDPEYSLMHDPQKKQGKDPQAQQPLVTPSQHSQKGYNSGKQNAPGVFALGMSAHIAPDKAIMLAYEKSSYDNGTGDRLPDLLPEWSVRRLVEAGARAIKILLYYNPFDKERINVIKQAYVERIGAECIALDMPFFLEPLVYDNAIGDEKGLEFAKKKPLYVARTMEEFSQPRYGVDVLKVELPINPLFVAQTRAFAGGQAAYTRQEALMHLRKTADATKLPFIYLSAGINNEVFCEMLELAAEAGAKFAGVLCGRATWQQGIQVYAREGVKALEYWLAEHGAQNIQALNRVLTTHASAWWDTYGGKGNIEIT
ncbi:tagatose 1,6-diphosphate aldolase [Ktedonobacter sp. SOSP1-85]|uniref:tagatose 1,6-diphosphate aldolase n=1 Tax=Ktedonobacter sp. SOSP1-85 TaxID=2778367 RepID=UPI001915111F|nr:tagatose 1,6-diphosphate aldolase [Ktedonobacter sp. SOSP1-85]GHO79817.1 tagatose 1,6-diphosphate aldolase [Ktedonobacter sp. SOSP1-85]